MSVHARTPLLTYAGNALVVRTSGPTVTAVCSSKWSWMSSGKSQSPCVVAAWVEATCGSSSLQWSVTALTPGNEYGAPNATTANPCTCSWSAYNLLSACTMCQDMITIQTWGTWKMGCSGFLSDTTYFPSDKGFTLPSETAIPFWAGRNPQTWHDAIFNESEAQTINSQGYADLTGTNSTSSSSPKPPVGAIVGGVIGGFVAIFFAAILCACGLIKRRRRLRQNKYSNGDVGHMRSMSDMSQKHLNPNGSGMVVQPGLPVVPRVMGGIFPMSPSMQMLSHTGGQAIMSAAPHIPFATSGIPAIPSAINQSFNLTMSPSSGASTYTTSSQNHPENIIVPFVSAQMSPRSISRKTTRGTGSPGSSHEFSEENIPPSSHRVRMNPPAYTARAGAGEVQTVAPTPREDGQRKHEYGPSIESHTWGAILEREDPGTGVATDGDSLDTRAPGDGLKWAGGTIAESSERESTVVGDGEIDAQKRSAHLPTMGISNRL